jgi:hypothetical protein
MLLLRCVKSGGSEFERPETIAVLVNLGRGNDFIRPRRGYDRLEPLADLSGEPTTERVSSARPVPALPATSASPCSPPVEEVPSAFLKSS